MYKILVIAYYFPPMGLSGVQRTLKFTKYMSHFNWKPTIITAGNIGYFAHDEFYEKKSLLDEADKLLEKITNSKPGRKDNKEFLEVYRNLEKQF